jgi:ketosteroid isomerase-like protein
MTTATRKLSTALVAVAVLNSSLADRALAAPNDAEDARNVVAAFATTWNRHDLEAFGKLFAPDANYVNVIGLLWTGRQSIQTHIAYSHGAIPADSPGFSEGDRRYYGIFKNSTLTFEQIDVRMLRKDVAVAHVSWELLGDARTQSARHGVYMFVVTRQRVGWLIATAQDTEVGPTVK